MLGSFQATWSTGAKDFYVNLKHVPPANNKELKITGGILTIVRVGHSGRVFDPMPLKLDDGRLTKTFSLMTFPYGKYLAYVQVMTDNNMTITTDVFRFAKSKE